MKVQKGILEDLMRQDKHGHNGLERETVEFALAHGFVLLTGDCDCIRPGKMTLLPTYFPRSVYDQIISVQPIYNKLYHLVAHDYQFLETALRSIAKSDHFIKNMWNIYKTIRSNGIKQELSLGLLRSDYMYTHLNHTFTAKQIEMNTIASSMGALSDMAAQTHRYTATKASEIIDSSRFPHNNCVSVLAGGLVSAWNAYNNKSAVIVFLVDVDEQNFSDIRKLQYCVTEKNKDIEVIYTNFKHIINNTNSCRITDQYQLIVDGYEAAVVYYRHGYDPSHYLDDRYYGCRLMIETSTAIKCPSIQYHLAGSKIIQQTLTNPGVLEKFLSDSECEEVRRTFVRIYKLGQEAGGDKFIKLAEQSPDDFVMKPQREGGGNNYFGDDIMKKWAELASDPGERDQFILMERIKPPHQYNCSIPTRRGQLQVTEMINEVGIYGAVLGDSRSIQVNKTGGYLLRTKQVTATEGGFMTGISSIDTPQLLTDDEMNSVLPN